MTNNGISTQDLLNASKVKGLILSLGAPNDLSGNLSLMAQERLNAVLNIYQYNTALQIACTGGIGKHFNETAHPHYYYSHLYLQKHGVPVSALATPVNSTNTIEDFTLSRELIYALSPAVLIIVTSDFHVERVKIIHGKFVNYPNTIFWGATTAVTDDVLHQLKQHEKKAIERLALPS
ncbi:DUF218 domain-containing protein [Chitinophaga niastensis]|uniref:DUF218 domain-containing protein n=1 Tax=Chitinophaga niastensis TaxID=536980 RepID=A0A2P8HC76_CHINA|nr:YdcF family protein [Chitinophaga niastensis]PSL43840.1 DUF218 domain-containing protein [Chitinophaga niastensis]